MSVQRQSGIAIQRLRHETYVAGGIVPKGRQSQTTKGKRATSDTDVLLPDKINTFFARFEDNTVPPTATKNCGLSFSVADVSKTFKHVNTRMAAGPDGP